MRNGPDGERPAQSASATGGERIVIVQALRLVAALLVTASHAELFGYHLGRFLGNASAREPLLDRGAFGVDLFFAISGFVMVVSSQRLLAREGGRQAFALRRLWRIVPLYWLATLATAAWKWRIHEPVTLAGLAQSLAFLPHRIPGGNRIAPVLEVGWTLNYEMVFYGLFACLMTAGAGRTVLRVSAALAALALTGAVVALPMPAWAWTRPIVGEFAGGMAIALAWQQGWRLPAGLRLAMVAVAVMLVAAGDFGAGEQDLGAERLCTMGLAAMLVLAAAVLGALRVPMPALWSAGGDLSYALYLCHMPLMSAAQFIWRHYRWGYGPAAEIGFIAGVSLLSLVVARIAHVRLERPLAAWVERRRMAG